MSEKPLANPAQLAQQLLTAANSLSDEEAGKRYQQILAQLPREQAAQLNALALTQVAPDQRRVLASGLKQAHNDPNRPFDGYDADDDDVAASPQALGRMSAQAARQDPALASNLLGGENSSLGGQIGKAALAALAALLIKQVLGGQNQQQGGATGPVAQGGAAGLDPVAAILGGLLGGGGQAQGSAGGDLGSILGGLLGGGAPSGQVQGSASGDLGSILGGLLGGGAPSGQAQGSASGDLGSILGGLLGGGAPSGQAQGSAGGDLGSILGSILGGQAPKSYRKD